MENKNQTQKLIIIVLIVLMVMLLGIFLYKMFLVGKTQKETVEIVQTKQEQDTLGSILKKYEVILNERNGTKIYVSFPRDLYNENGTSNKIYYYNMLNELADYMKQTYYLIDEEKDIFIQVFYTAYDDGTPPNVDIRINNQQEFFDKTDGKTYSDLQTVDIVEMKTINVDEGSVATLEIYSMNYGKFKESYGEPESTDEDGYEYYENGTIKVKQYDNNNYVRNMVYSKEHVNSFLSKIESDYSLEKVIEAYGEPGFGSVADGFVGYRNDAFYFFCYEDEISVYPYAYSNDSRFINYLTQYLDDGDLEKFQKVVRVVWDTYYEYEYDPEKQNLYLLYPSSGVEIDIKGNDSAGITFYNNFYFTDTVKKFVKDGKVTLNADEDLILKTELERKRNDMN